MDFISQNFILFSLLAVSIYFAFEGWKIKEIAFLILGFGFFLSLAPLKELTPLTLFFAFGYLVILISRRLSKFQFAFLLSIFIFTFALLRKYSLFNGISASWPPFVSLGISYVFFKILQVAIDVREGALKDAPTFTKYLAYILFFPTYPSGPIHRFQDFESQMNSKEPIEGNALTHFLFRVLIGYFKVLVVGSLLSYFQRYEWASFNLDYSSYHAVSSILLYTSFLYFNFSGCIDIAIGLAIAFGIRPPENFNRPFQARNFLDLWSRWHMSLSDWFKFYLFNPIVRFLTHKFSSPKFLPYLGAIGFFVTFFVMGLWHGSTGIFVAYGLFLGLGVSLNKLYQVEMARRLGKARYKKLSSNLFYQYICSGATYAYFSFGLICFWMSEDDLALFFTKFRFVEMLGLFLLSTGLMAILLFFLEFSFSPLRNRIERVILEKAK